MADLDLTRLLDKAHEKKPLAEVLALSPAALEGVTAKDAEMLQAAFGIKTIADLGRNKFFRRAQLLVQAADLAG
jgi:hypothetical protein